MFYNKLSYRLISCFSATIAIVFAYIIFDQDVYGQVLQNNSFIGEIGIVNESTSVTLEISFLNVEQNNHITFIDDFEPGYHADDDGWLDFSDQSWPFLGTVVAATDSLYRIVVKNSSTQTVLTSFYYVSCHSDLLEFYCPNSAYSEEADVYIVYTSSGEFEYIPLEFYGDSELEANVDFSSYFTDDNWIFPYNLDTYCNSTGCDIGLYEYFIMPQSSVDNVTLTAADLVQPSGRTWNFSGKSITIPNNVSMEINGALVVENSDFDTVSGSADIFINGNGTAYFEQSTVDNVDIDHSSSGQVTFGDGFIFNNAFTNLRTIDIDGPLELEGTVNLKYVTMNIEYGVTVDIENGEKVILTGASGKPTAVNVWGIFKGHSGGEIACSGSNAEVFGKGGTEPENVDFGDAGFINNLSRCTDSCVAAHAGSVVNLNTITVDGGGFLGLQAGGTFVVSDGVTITYESDARVPSFAPGSTIKMGDGSKIIFEKAVSIGGGANVTFTWATANTKWGWIELRADGNTFEDVTFQGGDKTIYVRSANNTFDNVTVYNGNNGIYAGPDYVSGNSGLLITDSTIEDNDGVGVYAYQSTVDITHSIIEDNVDEGVYLLTSTAYMESESANNQIQNNGGDEIGVYSSGQLYAGGSESDGNSNIVDVSGYLINNSTAFTALAENNWWGTASPTSGLFNGTVDYSPNLGSAVSFRVVGSGATLGDKILTAQNRIRIGKAIPSGADVADLYVLQGGGRQVRQVWTSWVIDGSNHFRSKSLLLLADK